MNREKHLWRAVRTGGPATFLASILPLLEVMDHNFLLVGVEAYPNDPVFSFVNQGRPWISGRVLAQMVAQEDFQWVWGGLLAFAHSVSEEIARSTLDRLCPPASPDEECARLLEIFPQTGAHHLLVAEDSTRTHLLTWDHDLVQRFPKEGLPHG